MLSLHLTKAAKGLAICSMSGEVMGNVCVLPPKGVNVNDLTTGQANYMAHFIIPLSFKCACMYINAGEVESHPDQPKNCSAASL